MFDNIKGIITFEAIVPDSNEFINSLKKSCISANHIKYKDGKIIGCIYNSDFEELKRIGTLHSAQISILIKKGAIFTAHKYQKRIGLVIGFILSVFMVAYLSNVVMIIEIYGNQTVSDKEVLSLLNDTGIHIGTLISAQDLRNAERQIVSSSDNISWIGIRSSGSKLQVEIREMDTAPEVVQENIPCNIVATKDAQIVDIKNVYAGMLVQMLHSGVKKGDLLISGTFEDGKGGVYYVHSRGEIIGKYNEQVVFKQAFSEETALFEETHTKKALHFFGIKIPLSISSAKFENYEYDEEITYLKLLDIQLPIGMIYSEYRPYRTETVQYSDEQVKAILTKKISLYEYNFLENEDIQVIDKTVNYEEANGILYAIVNYTLEGNIGISKEIMVK